MMLFKEVITKESMNHSKQ